MEDGTCSKRADALKGTFYDESVVYAVKFSRKTLLDSQK